MKIDSKRSPQIMIHFRKFYLIQSIKSANITGAIYLKVRQNCGYSENSEPFSPLEVYISELKQQNIDVNVRIFRLGCTESTSNTFFK
jgi:hypothetical protein